MQSFMLKRTLSIFIIPLLFFLAACKSSVKPENLYGKWKYIKVENPNASPPGSVPPMELKQQAPYIEFTQNNDLQIVWGGKVLSHGKFTVDGSNIHYKEVLPDGKVREFPFFISNFTGKDITFETLGEEGSRVTAIKE